MAAGLGTRMRSEVPKHLHPLLGRRMVDWVLEVARELGADPLVVVAAPATAAAFDGVAVAVQEQPLGTGDAVRSARGALDGERAMCSSCPATRRPSPPLCFATCSRRTGARTPSPPCSRSSRSDPRDYGRVLRNGDGSLEAIVEARTRRPEQLAVREVNSSIYVFRGARLWPVLDRLSPHNAQGELYLTDSIALLGRRAARSRCTKEECRWRPRA